MKYTILLKPNTNIAFYEQYLTMCRSELMVMLQAKACKVKEITTKKINKASFIEFDLEEALPDFVMKSIYRLSFFHILFEVKEDGLFVPMLIEVKPSFEDDLSTRLKYSGKTNEQITRMMMTLALNLSEYSDEEVINLMDPLCGRGTTLFEAMISGFNAFGVEKDKRAFNELTTYMTRYAKDARIKHNNKRGKAIFDGDDMGEFYELEYAVNKSDFKSKCLSHLKVLRGNTTKIGHTFRKNMMHLIVADLPYNIQHSIGKKGKVSDEGDGKSSGLKPLLREGLKEWDFYLKKGGCIAVSWNIYTDKRAEFEAIFEEMNYQVMRDHGVDKLEHRVAQAITRDIIIAKKL